VRIKKARAEAPRWGLSDRVSFATYDGNGANIPGADYDYVFTKSVLVVVPDVEGLLHQIRGTLKPGGELLSAENLAGGGPARRPVVEEFPVSAIEERVQRSRRPVPRQRGPCIDGDQLQEILRTGRCFSRPQRVADAAR